MFEAKWLAGAETHFLIHSNLSHLILVPFLLLLDAHDHHTSTAGAGD
jgi:hypothetical protein